MTLAINDIILSSRFFLGTAGYPSPDALAKSIEAAKPGLLTVSLRRENKAGKGQDFWNIIKDFKVPILPNTAGCQSEEEAITTAEMAREIFETRWIKLEVIGDDYTLQPDPYRLLKATESLIKKGFEVFPYMTDDLILANHLSDLGCNILMPWGAPMGAWRRVCCCNHWKKMRVCCGVEWLVLVRNKSHKSAYSKIPIQSWSRPSCIWV